MITFIISLIVSLADNGNAGSETWKEYVHTMGIINIYKVVQLSHAISTRNKSYDAKAYIL